MNELGAVSHEAAPWSAAGRMRGGQRISEKRRQSISFLLCNVGGRRPHPAVWDVGGLSTSSDLAALGHLSTGLPNARAQRWRIGSHHARTGPISLKTAHCAVFRALDAPEGKAKYPFAPSVRPTSTPRSTLHALRNLHTPLSKNSTPRKGPAGAFCPAGRLSSNRISGALRPTARA